MQGKNKPPPGLGPGGGMKGWCGTRGSPGGYFSRLIFFIEEKSPERIW